MLATAALLPFSVRMDRKDCPCMPIHAEQVTPIIERGLSKEAEEAPAPAAPPAAGMRALPELEQPLLAEEAPPPTPVGERAGLAKALAIIRWAGG